ncbi:MAG: GtrA family protein [Rikenellaceae bacterium]
MNRTKIREFFKFAIVGVVATGAHYGIYLLLLPIITSVVAYSIGYICSLILNFFLTSIFTFKEGKSIKKAIGFAVSHIINYTLHIVLLKIFINIGISESIAPLPVIMIVVPINFLLIRFVFKSKTFR